MITVINIWKKCCLFSAVIALIFFNSCNEDYVIEALEISVDALTREPFSIGDYHQGGIIIALDESGYHGLIAAIEDQGTVVPWWNGEFIETNATSMDDGKENTNKILEVQGRKLPYAAKLCADYEYEGYTDWFLPSKDQLELLYRNRYLLEGLSHEQYWSSTEHEIGRAWTQNFSTGEGHLKVTKESARMHIRAVREF